jgi:hypothetical protein
MLALSIVASISLLPMKLMVLFEQFPEGCGYFANRDTQGPDRL